MAKIAFFSPPGSRAEFMTEQAPDGMELVLVDPSQSDAGKVALCRDVDAIISSDVSNDVLRHCPNVKLVQTLPCILQPSNRMKGVLS